MRGGALAPTAALALLLPLVGCDRAAPHSDDARRIAERLIVEPPPSLEAVPADDKFEVAETVGWTFGGRDATAGWTATDPSHEVLHRPDRIVLICATTPCGLTRDTDFDATDVDAIEVVLDGATKTAARLTWSVDGDDDPERWISQKVFVSGTGSTVRWQVGGHEDWRGRITRLRFEPTRVAGQHVRIYALRGLQYRLPPTRLESLVGRPWTVTLDHETRPARLALPPSPIRWRVAVPRAAALRFGIAVPSTWRAPATFTVVADEGDGHSELFSTTLAPASGWHDQEVDLEPFADREIELMFEVDGPSVEAVRGFAAWSGPEIIAPGPPPGPNVVLISIDTLRADHLSHAGYSRPTTPHLDRWLENRAVRFEHAIASAPWTLPSHVSLMTGLDAIVHGVNHQRAMPRSLPTLAAQLRASGYRTVAVTGGGWLAPRYGFDHGFDRYRSWPVGSRRRDELEDHVDRTLDWLSRAPEPFFLFLHTFEVHSPHDRTRPFEVGDGTLGSRRSSRFFDSSIEARREAGYVVEKELLIGRSAREGRPIATNEEWQRAVAAYDNGIVAMDRQIGRLLDALERRAPSLVVVTSDHGEAFGDHGLASHGYLYDHNLRVPLLIAAPDERRPGRTIDRQVRLIDIAPTILDYVEGAAFDSIQGRSLRRLVEDGDDGNLPRTAISYASSSNLGISLRTANRFKYIFNNTPWPPIAGDERLYDLRSDPGEELDLAARSRDELERFRALARAALLGAAGRPALELINGSDEPMVGTLTGGCLQPLRVTTPDAGRAQFAWLKRDTASITLPAGGSVTLQFEAPEAPCVRLDATVGAREVTVEIDAPTRPSFGAALIDGKLQSVDDRMAIGVGFWWTPATEAALSEEPNDDALRRQLEALGYLD